MKKIMKLGGIGVVILFIITMISSFFTSVDMSWQNIEAGYYRQIVMLPNGKFIGICKVNDSEAKDAGVIFKVEKEDGLLKRIVSTNNGTLQDASIPIFDGNTDFFFTTMDSIIFKELKISVNNKDLEYSWDCGKTTRKLIFTDGAVGLPSAVIEPVTDKTNNKKTFSYKDGKIVEVKNYRDREDNPSVDIWEYNNNMLLPSSISFKGAKDIKNRNEYRYDSENRIIEKRFYEVFYDQGLQPYQNDGSTISIAKYSNILVAPNNRFDAFCLASIIHYTYTDNNPFPNVIEAMDKDGNLLNVNKGNFARVMLKYDDKCRIIQVNTYYADGSPAPIPESKNYIGGGMLKDKAVISNPPTYEIRVKYDGDNFIQENITNRPEIPKNSQSGSNKLLSLGGISLDNSASEITSKLGAPITTENKDGVTVQKYKDVEVHVSNGQIQMIVSNSPNAQTSRGIHEQSSIHDAVKAYGGAYETSEYGNYDLIEYKVNDAKIGECIIRFAVEKNNNKVNYISIRRAG